MLKSDAYEILVKYVETNIEMAEALINKHLEVNHKAPSKEWCEEQFSFIHRYWDLYVAMVENGNHNMTYFARMNNIKNAYKIVVGG